MLAPFLKISGRKFFVFVFLYFTFLIIINVIPINIIMTIVITLLTVIIVTKYKLLFENSRNAGIYWEQLSLVIEPSGDMNSVCAYLCMGGGRHILVLSALNPILFFYIYYFPPIEHKHKNTCP